MTASLSAYLLDQYYSSCAARTPFGQPASNNTPPQRQEIAISGPMSYAPHMHGLVPLPFQHPFLDHNMISALAVSSGFPATSASGSAVAPGDTSSFYADISEATAQKIASLQAKLDKKLGPEYISQRPGPGGSGLKLTYAEGWKIINLANEVFGFNGWSSSVVNINTDFVDYCAQTGRWNVGVSAVVRVTLRDGVFHEDVGYGMLENSKSKGAALDKCKKEAVTDGVKRCLRNFGNLLGNCLYDKQYTQEVVKMKISPAKFDKSSLHRRPEVQGGSSSGSTGPVGGAATSKLSAANAPPKPSVPIVIPKAIGVHANHGTPIRQESGVPASTRPAATSTPPRVVTVPRSSQANKGGNVAVHQMPQPHNGIAVVQPSITGNSSSATAVATSNHTSKVGGGAAHQKKPAARQEPDAYSFESDEDVDDAEFLAALEKAEGDAIYNDLAADLGRPIGEDEGTSGVIVLDETTDGPEIIDLCGDTSSSDEKTLVDATGRKSSPPNNLKKDADLGFAAGKPLFQRMPSSQGRKVETFTASRNVMQPRSTTTVPAVPRPPTADSDEVAKQIVALRQQRRAAAAAASAAGSVTNSGSLLADENSNHLSKPVRTSITPSSSLTKPRTPSMGGFNFPPGMNLSGPGHPLSSAVRQSQAVSVSVGMKRSADGTMKNVTPAGGGLRAGSGPGVSYADIQARSGVRQPFARLDDLPEGGDAKRVRR